MKKKPQPPRPWEENPEDYFFVFGAFLRPLPENKQAAKIIEEHGLNSPRLIFARCEYLKEIQKFADLWTRETDPVLKEIIESEIFAFIDRKKEFAFFGREFAKALGVPSE
jgi:hypothetical protein